MRSFDGVKSSEIFDPKLCAKFYLIVALPVLLFLAFAIPPLEASDEAAHFLRINSLSQGGLLPLVNLHDEGVGGEMKSAGGLVDASVRELIRTYPIQKNRSYHTTPEMIQKLSRIGMSGKLEYVGHSNTAIYPPFLYLMPIVGVTAARIVETPVLFWLYAARLMNVLFGATVIFWAIGRSGDAAPFLLICSTLPLILFQQATVSADAALFPLFILFASLLRRIAVRDRIFTIDIVFICITTLFICVGKIAYLPLSLLPLFAQLCRDQKWNRTSLFLLLTFVITIISWAAWAFIIKDKVFTIIPAIHVDPKQQLALITRDIGSAVFIFVKSMVSQVPRLAVGLVGSRLGWMDLVTPRLIVFLSLLAMGSSALVGSNTVRRNRATVLAVIAAAIVCYLIIYLLLYLQFNMVGGQEVKGVEGRYLTPLIFLVGVMLGRQALSARSAYLARKLLFGWAGLSGVITASITLFHYW